MTVVSQGSFTGVINMHDLINMHFQAQYHKYASGSLGLGPKFTPRHVAPLWNQADKSYPLV